MIRNLIDILKRSSLARSERGGIVLITLLAFMVLAVPLAVGAAKTSSQLSRSSQTYDELLQESYDAGSALEYGFSQILDPAFTDALLPGAPTILNVDINGESVALTVTEIPTSKALQGQGLVTTELTVTPTSAPVEAGTPETFHYEIVIRNEGTDTLTLEQIVDYLPPLITYTGPIGGNITSNDPVITTDDGVILCGDAPDTLTWDVSPGIDILPDEKKTLSFEASGTLTEGIYYNQVRVRSRPWWDVTALVDIYTPYTAAIVVQDDDDPQECGFDMDLLIDKQVVDVQTLESGEKEATYTITVANVFSEDLPINYIEDLLPPDFTYVDGSTSGSVTSADPTEVLDPDLQRWRLRWGDGSSPTPLLTIGEGDTETLTFKATGIVEVGLEYYNEVRAKLQVVADVVLVLDNSGSIDDVELVELKAAADAIVDAFSLDTTEGRIRIGITRFRGSSVSVVGMTDVDVHPMAVPLHDGIDSLVQGGPDLNSGTNIVFGLGGGGSQFSTGLGDRPEAPNMMIFVTDGNDNRGNSDPDIEAASLATGAEVFAVGVGNVTASTLDAIATDPNADHVFDTGDFQGLIDLVDDIVASVSGALATQEGGASLNASISGGKYYDLEAVALDGIIQARVLLAGGQITLLSWQEY